MSKKKIPTQPRKASIDIFSESIVATSYDHGSRPVQKLITPAEAVEIFTSGGHGRSQTQWLDFGPEVIRVGVTRCGDVVVLMIRKAKRTKIHAEISGKRRYFTILMPSLLCQLRQRGSAWADIDRVFAFHGSLKRTTKLYAPPVPNGHSDGSLCMGSVSMGPVAHLSAAEAFESAYIDSTFTDHTGPLKSGSKYRNIWDAIKKTKGKVPFSELEKITTFGAFLNEN